MRAGKLRWAGWVVLGMPWVAGAGPDTQFWLDQSVSHVLGEDLKLRVKLQERWVDDVSRLNHLHVEGGVTRRLQAGQSLGFNVRHQGLENAEGDWQHETWPIGVLSFKGNILGWPVSQRNRIEWRVREERGNRFLARAGFKVDAPRPLGRWKVRPYVADEVFFDVREESFWRNRIFMGLKLPVGERVGLDLYGMFESTDRAQRWQENLVGGIRLALTL